MTRSQEQETAMYDQPLFDEAELIAQEQAERLAQMVAHNVGNGGKLRDAVLRTDGIEPRVKLRVRGTLRLLDREWAEVRLQVRINADRPWLDLTHDDRPMLVARRFSGEREAHELYVIVALKQTLASHGAVVFGLEGSEERVGNGSTEYRYWARLGARFSVALQTAADGTVAVVGLA